MRYAIFRMAQWVRGLDALRAKWPPFVRHQRRFVWLVQRRLILQRSNP
jgi:hypothetical protein